MGLNLPLKTETFSASEDQSWLGSAHGTNEADPITLDGDQFLTLFPTGVVPSGVVLYKHSGGLYRPFGGVSADETQSLTRTSTGGTITLAFDGKTTGNIAASAAGFTAAAVNAALLAAGFTATEIVATGADGGPLTLTFGGQYADEDVALITVDNTNATGGTIVAAQVAAGGTDTETAAGHLFTTVDLGGTTAAVVGNVSGALYWHGEVIVSKLPTNHGLTTGAQADLKHIRYV